MMTEVAKEVASRCRLDLDFFWGLPTANCKVTVSLEGWGAPCTFEMAGESYSRVFNRVIQALGTKFTIKELHFREACPYRIGCFWTAAKCGGCVSVSCESRYWNFEK